MERKEKSLKEGSRSKLPPLGTNFRLSALFSHETEEEDSQDAGNRLRFKLAAWNKEKETSQKTFRHQSSTLISVERLQDVASQSQRLGMLQGYRNLIKKPTKMQVLKDQLANRRKQMNLFELDANDVQEETEEDLAFKGEQFRSLNDVKFQAYKGVYMKSLLNSVNHKEFRLKKINDEEILRMYKQARVRNLFSEPIPIKKTKGRQIQETESDVDLVVKNIGELPEGQKQQFKSYLKEQSNLRMTEIPVICGMRYARVHHQSLCAES